MRRQHRRRTVRPTLSETRLYAAVKAFLEAQGFEAKGEVCGCDVVAVRLGQPPVLVICEMKLGFNLELLLQAADRMAAADAVWLAVPRTRRGRDRDRRVVRLCRLLGLGLLTVGADGAVVVLADPAPYCPRPNGKRRARLLREHGRRRGDPTPGGSVRRTIMTAYRQRAMACAEALRDGPATTQVLAAIVPEAPAILLRNAYGWFERVERGTYGLSQAGRQCLAEQTRRGSDLVLRSFPSAPRQTCRRLPGTSVLPSAVSKLLMREMIRENWQANDHERHDLLFWRPSWRLARLWDGGHER